MAEALMQHTANIPMPATKLSTGGVRGARKCRIVQAGSAGNSLVRLLSGKYDMGTLRDLSSTEEEVTKELVHMFQVESEDELPISFDLQQLVDVEEGERRAFLESMLQTCCASDAIPTFIDKCLGRVSRLDARASDTTTAAGPLTVCAMDRRQ